MHDNVIKIYLSYFLEILTMKNLCDKRFEEADSLSL